MLVEQVSERIVHGEEQVREHQDRAKRYERSLPQARIAVELGPIPNVNHGLA
jgi:hypothetical protein